MPPSWAGDERLVAAVRSAKRTEIYRQHRRLLQSARPADVWHEEGDAVVVVAFDATAENYETLLMMAVDSQTLVLRQAGWLAVDLTAEGWQISHTADNPANR